MGKPKQMLGEADQTPARPIIDYSAAHRLSASLANESRFGFAQSFSAEIVTAYGQLFRHRSLLPSSLVPPPSPGSVTLTSEAKLTARQIAAGIGLLSPAQAAYAIGNFYTTLLPEAFRAQHGIFYTPPALVERLLVLADESGIDWKTARVLDPACGGGAFLIAVAERMLRALDGSEPTIILQSIGGRLRGFEIDPFGAWLARAMLGIALQPLARASGRHIPDVVDTRDSLELRLEEGERFDLVVGNPPYGRVTLPPIRRQRFARSEYGHANLYGVFTDAALHWVKRGGVIGYVTPTSMLSGLYYRALRALLADKAPPLAVNLISERDGVFADVLQETMLATYRKGGLALPGRVGFIDVTGDQKIVSHKAGNFALPVTPHSPWLLPRSPK
jgi:adenine-specific DNA-methyltransferase